MKYELFPTLIKEYNVSDYPQKEKLLKKIFNYPTRNHSAVRGGVSSFKFERDPLTLNFLTSEGFKDLSDFFSRCSEDYSKEVGIQPGVISNCWFNIMGYKNQTLRHHHAGCIIAGAYYPLLEDASCNLIFHSPIFNLQQTWFNKISQKSQSRYSNSDFSFPIKQDHLYLFPGWLDHSTEINRAKNRVVISFNVVSRPPE